MKAFDRLLQRWRIAMASPYIADGARVLDVGCADGALLWHLAPRIREGIGIDPALERVVEDGRIRLLPGRFPGELPELGSFDVIAMLATLEHLPEAELPAVGRACARLLEPGGRLIITVPSPLVDRIVHALIFLRLMEGTAIHEHHGFEPDDTPTVFLPYGLELLARRGFELGLNNLFLFRKRADARAAAPARA